jgi:hypothetical protein
VEQDPFISFLSNLTEKISVEKEHKALMEKINSDQPAPTVSPLEKTLAKLQEKINQQVQNHLHETELVVETVKGSQPIIEENNFEYFVDKLKDILDTPNIEEPVEDALINKPKKEANVYVQELKKQSIEQTPDSIKYINDLDKLTAKVIVEKQPEKVEDVKKLIEEYVTKYARRILDLGGGGGSVAKQFADGGTMNGDLNVIGNYLSGGVNLLNVLSGSSSTYNPLYTYVNSNFSVSIPTGSYAVDTTTSGVTAILPTTPTFGTTISFMDPYYTWTTNNFILTAPNNIQNQNQSVAMSIAGYSFKAVYVGGTYGWRIIQ